MKYYLLLSALVLVASRAAEVHLHGRQDPVTVADQMAAAAEAHVSAASAIKEAAEALKETAASLKAGAQEVADSATEEENLKNAVRAHIAQSTADLDKLENTVMSEPKVQAPCPSPAVAAGPAS